MGEIVNLDAKRLEKASKEKQEKKADNVTTTVTDGNVTYNFHEPVYTPVDKVEFAIRTEVLSEAVTNHAKKIDALKPNQRLVVEDIKINELISILKGELQESENN